MYSSSVPCVTEDRVVNGNGFNDFIEMHQQHVNVQNENVNVA